MSRQRSYGQADDAPADVGDVAWTGVFLNAEPSQLQPGLLSDGTNLRCRTGRPVTRRGVWKPAWLNKVTPFDPDLGEAQIRRVIPWNTINGKPEPFSDPNGVEWIMHAADEGVFALRTYNTPLTVPLPAGVKILTEVSFVQAFNLMFMARGELMAPLVMETVDKGFQDMVPRWDSTKAYEEAEVVAWGPWVDGNVTHEGSTMTVATLNPHGLITGCDVQVRNTSGDKQNGRYTVTVLDEYTFTFQAADVTSVLPTLQWSQNRDYWITAAAVPLQFEEDDIANLRSLAAKLDSPTREIDKWLKGTLPADTLAALEAYDGSATPPVGEDTLRTLLTRDLNGLIHGPSIYDEARFEGVSLRTETKAMIGKDLEGDDLIRFNRMLLEDAYPLDLKRSVETDVPAGEEPGESSRWTREYLILPNFTNGIFVNNRLLVTTSWIPGGQFTSGGYGAKRDFVAASYVLDYIRYSPKNEFRINQGSADELQSLLKIGDTSVLCLKSQSVGLLTNLTGDTLQLLSLEMIIRKYGVANPRAATEVGRDAVFVSPRRGVVSLRQTEQNKIQGTEIAFSDPIRQWIAQIDWTLSHKIRVEYWNDALYVAAPVGSSESYSLNWLAGLEYVDVIDFRGQPFLHAGMTIRWDPSPDNSEWFIANGQTFKARTQLEWDGKSILGIHRVGVDDAPLPTTSSMRRVYVDVNTAVLVYDYQTGQWQPIDRGVSLSVREWFVATVDGIERLCAATEDGYLNLYEESDAGDQVFNPNAPNFLSLAPIHVEGKTRGYTGGSAGFKAGQFARLVLATRAPRYSVESATEGVSETSKLVTDQTRDRRIYERPAGVKRWKADNANHDFFTPWRRDYSVVLESEVNPLNLSTGETLDLFSFLSLDLSPHPIGFDLGQGVPVDLMQEANHSLRLVRQRGRWHQGIISNSEGIIELRAIELQLQETSRQVGIKV